MNIQSIKDCDPTKFNKEMGPHYVSILKKIKKNKNFNLKIVDNKEICGIQCRRCWNK